CCMLVFVFSSRGRHTVWPRDWSSDVCSSDLAQQIDGLAVLAPARRRAAGDVVELAQHGHHGGGVNGDGSGLVVQRDVAAGDGDEIGRASCRVRVTSMIVATIII